MHLMTFDPDFDLKWGQPTEQPNEICSGMFADVDKPSCTLFRKGAHESYSYLSDQLSKMHQMTSDTDFGLIWGHPSGQQGKISSGMVADIDKPSCPLCRKSAHKS